MERSKSIQWPVIASEAPSPGPPRIPKREHLARQSPPSPGIGLHTPTARRQSSIWGSSDCSPTTPSPHHPPPPTSATQAQLAKATGATVGAQDDARANKQAPRRAGRRLPDTPTNPSTRTDLPNHFWESPPNSQRPAHSPPPPRPCKLPEQPHRAQGAAYALLLLLPPVCLSFSPRAGPPRPPQSSPPSSRPTFSVTLSPRGPPHTPSAPNLSLHPLHPTSLQFPL